MRVTLVLSPHVLPVLYICYHIHSLTYQSSLTPNGIKVVIDWTEVLMDISDPTHNSAHKGTAGAMPLVSFLIAEAARCFRRSIEIDRGLLLRERYSALIIYKRIIARCCTGLTSSSFPHLLSTCRYCYFCWSRHESDSLGASSRRNCHDLLWLARHSEGLIQISF